jgi:hypothetical protein
MSPRRHALLSARHCSGACMDLLTFIAEIVKASAWPVATFAIAILFRKQFRDLLARIRKGKVGSAEFEFEQEVRGLSEEAPEALLPPTPVAPPTLSLATTNPRAAILEAWLKLESAAHRLAYNNHLPSPSAPRSLTSILRSLEKSGLLQFEDVALFNDLRVLRNQATHDADFSPSPESVIQYVQLAQALKERMDRASSDR